MINSSWDDKNIKNLLYLFQYLRDEGVDDDDEDDEEYDDKDDDLDEDDELDEEDDDDLDEDDDEIMTMNEEQSKTLSLLQLWITLDFKPTLPTTRILTYNSSSIYTFENSKGEKKYYIYLAPTMFGQKGDLIHCVELPQSLNYEECIATIVKADKEFTERCAQPT